MWVGMRVDVRLGSCWIREMESHMPFLYTKDSPCLVLFNEQISPGGPSSPYLLLTRINRVETSQNIYNYYCEKEDTHSTHLLKKKSSGP